MTRQELSSLKFTLALVAALALLPPIVVGLIALGGLVGIVGFQVAKHMAIINSAVRRPEMPLKNSVQVVSLESARRKQKADRDYSTTLGSRRH